jgi:hypothetical protein
MTVEKIELVGRIIRIGETPDDVGADQVRGVAGRWRCSPRFANKAIRE